MRHVIKLLIIDDENEILATYKNFFIKRGFEVETAQEGEEGLQKLRKGEFDVAIIDILMPKMDGLTLVNHIADEGIDTSVIILTGHGEKDDAIKAINSGVVGAWFEKSNIKMDTLLEKTNNLAEVLSLDDVTRILAGLPTDENNE